MMKIMDNEKIPKDERKKMLEELDDYEEEGTSKIGENRKQLFVRIPKKVADELKLKRGDELNFKTRKGKLEVEVVK